jgi:hypothetical protein
MVDDRVAELAYLEGVRALDGQKSSLDVARSTASAALGVASIGTGFLSSAALDGQQGLPWLAWAAIVLLVMTVAATAVVLWPRRWVFTNEPETIASDAWQRLSAAEAHTTLARYMAEHLSTNARPLQRRWYVTEMAISTAAASILCWTVLIGAK